MRNERSGERRGAFPRGLMRGWLERRRGPERATFTPPRDLPPDRAGLVGQASPPPVFRPRTFLPKGVKQTPKGDIGEHRGKEAKAVGGFKGAKTMQAATYFKQWKKKS